MHKGTGRVYTTARETNREVIRWFHEEYLALEKENSILNSLTIFTETVAVVSYARHTGLRLVTCMPVGSGTILYFLRRGLLERLSSECQKSQDIHRYDAQRLDLPKLM
jgi:hypothetical protein